MNEIDKWYWRFKGRLEELEYDKLEVKIQELMSRRNQILKKVISEFASEHSSGNDALH